MLRRRLPVVALMAATALSACSSGGKSSSDGQDLGAAHVHGLGVNPADGVLYAATHHGVFRVPADGTAQRVGEHFQDTMGFTVTGPDTFLGSGHADPEREPNLPAALGLIRSTTAGRSWTPVSLSGSVDFHALHASQGLICGWDSGSRSLMASSDEGRTWETRSVLDLWDFALAPHDSKLVLATGQQGLRRSVDGGRTWKPAGAGPLLVLLAWPEPGQLFGVGADGTVWFSADSGGTWAPRGSADGQPEAVTVDERAGKQTLYVAAGGQGILTSTDGGRSFTTLYVYS